MVVAVERAAEARSAERKLTRLHVLFVHLLYLDDSGSVPNVNEKYFVLAGLSIFEAQADWFTRELDKLAESVDPADPGGVEFHASAMYARRSAPWNKMSREEAHGVTKALLQIVATSYDTARVFACAVEKASVPSGGDPVAVAFEDLCSRFDMYLSRLRSEGDRQRGLLILDKSTHETSLQQLTREFRKLGTQWGSIHNLADIPFFADSGASRLIQCADHIAYAVFRRYHVGDSQLFDIIAPKFHASEGVIHGLAHKAINTAQCLCPACLSRRLVRGQPPQAPQR